MTTLDLQACTTTPLGVGPLTLGGGGLGFLLGPCVLEPGGRALRIAEGIARVTARLGVPWIFKASFDKANRSAGGSYRGPGLEAGLRELQDIGRALGVPLTTDVHAPEQAAPAAQVVDLLQVPAFLCRQTDLLLACGATGKPVNVKKGQFVAPADMRGAVGKLPRGACMLTERGSAFGHGDLVVDLRGLGIMRGLGVPVCFDATHSVQRPGGGSGLEEAPRTGGERRFVGPLARAAVAAGVDAVFLEVHDRPEEALSDGPNMVPLAALEPLLEQLLAIHAALAPGRAP